MWAKKVAALQAMTKPRSFCHRQRKLEMRHLSQWQREFYDVEATDGSIVSCIDYLSKFSVMPSKCLHVYANTLSNKTPVSSSLRDLSEPCRGSCRGSYGYADFLQLHAVCKFVHSILIEPEHFSARVVPVSDMNADVRCVTPSPCKIYPKIDRCVTYAVATIRRR